MCERQCEPGRASYHDVAQAFTAASRAWRFEPKVRSDKKNVSNPPNVVAATPLQSKRCIKSRNTKYRAKNWLATSGFLGSLTLWTYVAMGMRSVSLQHAPGDKSVKGLWSLSAKHSEQTSSGALKLGKNPGDHVLLLVGSGERNRKNYHTSPPSSIPSPSMSRSASMPRPRILVRSGLVLDAGTHLELSELLVADSQEARENSNSSHSRVSMLVPRPHAR